MSSSNHFKVLCFIRKELLKNKSEFGIQNLKNNIINNKNHGNFYKN